MTQSATVSTELELRLVVPGGPSLPLLADLRYLADDPWAVRVAFRTGGEGDGVVEWMFARQLLVDGLSHPTGDGDVRVWPSMSIRRRVVHLRMTSPSGSAVFEIERQDVLDFLSRTQVAVPQGTEESAVDLDAELAQLLRDR